MNTRTLNIDSVPDSTVLVVEDEAMIRMVLADALEDAGFNVVEANGADAAIAVLKRRSDIGVVITDVRMPGSMDGIGLTKWLQENEPKIPVIVCSGIETGIDWKAHNPAIVCMISKPYLPEDMVSRVAALMGVE